MAGSGKEAFFGSESRTEISKHFKRIFFPILSSFLFTW